MSESPFASRLYIYWCPRCQVQSEWALHFCKRGPALIPQLDEETHCERIEVVPKADDSEWLEAWRDEMRRVVASWEAKAFG